jgi:hypothetical protein
MFDWTVRMMNTIIRAAITISTMPMAISTGLIPPNQAAGPSG